MRINDDLTVHPISLKQIVENLDKIPEKTGKFGEETNNLSREEKKKLMELMRKYNEFGKALRGDQALMETARNLSEMAQLAKKYAMNENNMDFLQKETIKRDYKNADNIVKEFQKRAKDCVNHLMQLNALYEDAGKIFERYYDMSEMVNEVPVEEPVVEPEVKPNVTPQRPPAPKQPTTPMPRHPLEPDPGQQPRPKGECATCGCGRPLDPHTNECTRCGCGKPHDDHGIPMTPGEEQEEYASGF